MYFKNGITIGSMILLLASCATNLYLPTYDDATSHNISLSALQSGRELYISKCSTCHNLFLPNNYTKPEWLLIMSKMEKPAKIDSTQKDLIMKYVDTGNASYNEFIEQESQ